MGVELELSRCDLLRDMDLSRLLRPFAVRWEHDGSVQPSGLELVTMPAAGDVFLTGLKTLAGHIVTTKAAANETCGFHVHVDGGALSMFELRRLLVGFSLIEDQLYGPFVPQARWTNTYCRPLQFLPETITHLMGLRSTQEIHNWIYRYLYELSEDAFQGKGLTPKERAAERAALSKLIDTFKAKKYMNAARRKTLNLHSWEMRGTVEFRLQAGTADPDTIVFWPLFCGHLLQNITNATDRVVSAWNAKPPALSNLLESWNLPKDLKAWTDSKLKLWASRGH